jgi:hypothetical protein
MDREVERELLNIINATLPENNKKTFLFDKNNKQTTKECLATQILNMNVFNCVGNELFDRLGFGLDENEYVGWQLRGREEEEEGEREEGREEENEVGINEISTKSKGAEKEIIPKYLANPPLRLPPVINGIHLNVGQTGAFGILLLLSELFYKERKRELKIRRLYGKMVRMEERKKKKKEEEEGREKEKEVDEREERKEEEKTDEK